MDNYDSAKSEILNLLKKNQEESRHADNTINWLLILKPDSDFVLQISALAHDIERIIYPKDEKQYLSHKEFKIAHCQRSVEVTKEILARNKINSKDIKLIEETIQSHEFGGTREANLIRDADSLANFQWCDEMFGKLELNSLKETMTRMYKRMSKENRKFIDQIRFNHPEVMQILQLIEKN